MAETTQEVLAGSSLTEVTQSNGTPHEFSVTDEVVEDDGLVAADDRIIGERWCASKQQYSGEAAAACGTEMSRAMRIMARLEIRA